MKPTVIYRWPKQPGYIVDALAPDATCLLAYPGDTCEEVLERLQGRMECFWFHLDCSITADFPADRPKLLASLSYRGVQVINGHVTDISKKYIQQFNRDHGFPDVLAAETGDPDEMVMVKSNYNSFGRTERQMSKWGQDRLGLKQSEMVPVNFEYRVEARSSVDSSCWTNPALVCERFVHNHDGIWYRAYVRRPRIAVCQFRCPTPIKRPSKSTLDRTIWLGAADDPAASNDVTSVLLRFVDAFQFDFGAIDLVMDLNGVPAVIDVNTTPYNANQQPSIISFLTD